MNTADSRQSPEGDLRQTELTTEAAARASRALRVGWIILGAAVVLFLYNLYSAVLGPVWQQFVIVGVSLVMGVAAVISVWLSRRGRCDEGAWFAIGGVLLVCLAGALLFKGLGLSLGVAAVLLTGVVAGQSLVQRQATRAVAVGVFVGLLVLFIELNEPTWRSISAVSPTAATIIVIALVLIYGISAVRQFANYTLRTKLMIAFLTVSLVPLGLSSYLNNRTTTLSTTASVGANLKGQAGSKALTIGDHLAQQVDLLKTLSMNRTLQVQLQIRNAGYPDDLEAVQAEIGKLDQRWRLASAANDDADALVQAHLFNSIATSLREYQQAFPGNADVFVTDRYGALLAATDLTSDYDQADKEWWQAAWNGGKGATYISQPTFDESGNTFDVVIAAPVRDSVTGGIIGVLCTTYRLEVLKQSLTSAQLGRTGRVELYLSGGQILTDKGFKAQIEPRALLQLQATTGDYAELSYEGRPSLASQAPVAATTGEPVIANLGWSVIVYQDREESLALVQAQTRAALLLALLIAGVVTGAAIGGAQVLAGPIARLTAVAEKVTAGDLTAQAAVEARDEVGALAGTFNTMVAQLRQTLAGLEQRVADRTRELERRAKQVTIGAEIARVATASLDPDQLTAQAVELLQDRFGFYSVSLYLLDEQNRYLVLKQGSGQAGRLMKEQGFRLEVGGQSMNGWVAANKQARIAMDITQDAWHFAHPLLPDTRAEMALPLRLGERVLGTLDVLSAQAGAFDQSDIAALQGMADQIAVALENARLFQQTQKALKELDETSRMLTRQGWQDYLTLTEDAHSAEFSPADARPATRRSASSAPPRVLHVPLELRGQSIGALVMEREENSQPWTHEETEAIRAIAQQAVLALDGARLFEETQRRAARERLINEITARIRGSVSMEAVLNSAVREISQATGASFAAIDLELELAQAD